MARVEVALLTSTRLSFARLGLPYMQPSACAGPIYISEKTFTHR